MTDSLITQVQRQAQRIQSIPRYPNEDYETVAAEIEDRLLRVADGSDDRNIKKKAG